MIGGKGKGKGDKAETDKGNEKRGQGRFRRQKTTFNGKGDKGQWAMDRN